ncbi:hypothetical protein [Neisseria sp.]|uniref:hypothetical protein n=1 Tax=Neisseria sp. TaxID=192066 RepID=UPI0035A146DD
MLKQATLALLLAAGLSGCISYGHQRVAISPEQEAAMADDSRRVQDAERAERAERRGERRQEMMDEADAIHRAYGNRNIYLVH